MNNRAHLRPDDFDSSGDIIPMSWKEEKGDLISREALKKDIEENSIVLEGVKSIEVDCAKALIDNAPTVEITEEQAIDKLHETGWLPVHDKEMTVRPHGKWINETKITDKRMFFRCSHCNAYDCERSNFCKECGADMRSVDKGLQERAISDLYAAIDDTYKKLGVEE